VGMLEGCLGVGRSEVTRSKFVEDSRFVPIRIGERRRRIINIVFSLNKYPDSLSS
jgi:hypothetical protein